MDDDFFSLDFGEEDEGEHLDGAADDVLAAAKRYTSGNAVAQQVYGNGKLRRGSGALDLDWCACVEHMRAAPEGQKATYAQAIGTFAQVQAHGDALRAAGAVEAATELLRVEHSEEVQIAAAEAIRHLACANNGNRIAASDAGAIPLLVQMLQRVADASSEESSDLSASDAAVVTAATAALRNLSFQNGPNRDEIRFSGGLAPLLRIVARGEPPVPPPSDTHRREAAYRAAGVCAGRNQTEEAPCRDARTLTGCCRPRSRRLSRTSGPTTTRTRQRSWRPAWCLR